MGRDRFIDIMAHRNVDTPGLWLGDPKGAMLERLLAFYGARDRLSLAELTGEDMYFLPADAYMHVQNGIPFAVEPARMLADCACAADLDLWDGWPSPCIFDFGAYEQAADAARAKGLAVTGGMWSCFFHYLAGLFGMENYFILMHTAPDIVHAATRRVVDWLLNANAQVFARMGGKLDAFFMGNDFGTQKGLIISPKDFRTFIKPYYAELIKQAKDAGLACMVHSCGAVGEVIPDLIELGVDALHPLQALADGMNADALSTHKGSIAFAGGIDAQRLLPLGTPEEVEREVARVANKLGANWIASPSHEGYQADVSPENIDALVRAVKRMNRPAQAEDV